LAWRLGATGLLAFLLAMDFGRVEMDGEPGARPQPPEGLPAPQATHTPAPAQLLLPLLARFRRLAMDPRDNCRRRCAGATGRPGRTPSRDPLREFHGCSRVWKCFRRHHG